MTDQLSPDAQIDITPPSEPDETAQAMAANDLPYYSDVTPDIPLPAPKKGNPLTTRRMTNAYARTMGCGEYSPDERCEHRIVAERFLDRLARFYEAERV